MKIQFLCTALLTLSITANAKSDAELRHEMQLTVSKAFSECAAYFENVDASDMQGEATARAVAHAADVEGTEKVRQIVEADFAEAKAELAELAERDPEAFEDAMADDRRRCRMAANDPTEFVEKTLRNKHSRITNFRLPDGLTAEKILQNAKPASGIKNRSQCTEPAIGHDVSLDDLLVEGGMVCLQHEGGVCESERSWMSFRQYIQRRYPDRPLAGYSEKLSVTFKNGKSQSVRTLVACLEVPRLST